MEYLNLDLETDAYEVVGDDERFKIRVSGSPVGEQKHGDAVPVTITRRFRQSLESLDQHRLSRQDLFDVGKQLGGLLFPPTIRAMLERSRERLKENQGLRIRLNLDRYALVDIPWEYAYLTPPGMREDADILDGFLSLDRKFSIVRYETHSSEFGFSPSVSSGGKLRLVALLADPAQPPDYPDLGLKDEMEKIRTEVLANIPAIDPHYCYNVTAEMILPILNEQAHILHFAGHAKFEGDMGRAYGTCMNQGYLVLMDMDGGRVLPAKKYSSEKLGANLKLRGPRLAMLGACKFGRTNLVNSWIGIAPALTRSGIRAVIGMQYSMPDKNAIVFSRAFYDGLTKGKAVDEAVNDGRLAILNRSIDDGDRDWGVPVLHMRADEEGVLFPELSPDYIRTGAAPDQHGSNVAINMVASLAGTEDIRTFPSAEAGAARSAGGPARQAEQARTLRRKLRTILETSFSIEDLEVLCADIEDELQEDGINLQVNLEMIGGEGKSVKVLRLIDYLDNNGRFEYILAAVRAKRPNVI